MLLVVIISMIHIYGSLSGDKVIELTVVYVGSTSCNACIDQTNISNVNLVISKIKNNSSVVDNNYYVRTVGIAFNNSLENGFNHLNEIYKEFDEISVGLDMYNIGIHRYFYENFKGRLLTPQILVLIREYEIIDLGKEFSFKKILEESLLYRLFGVEQIENYLKNIDSIKFNNFIE